MLFNSYQFIFLFLPMTLGGYVLLARFGNEARSLWLALASVAFYAASNWQFVPLLLSSVAFNFLVGSLLLRARLADAPRFAVLTAGVAINLLALGYFKYAGFLATNLDAAFSTHLVVNVMLPVGISFYTFTQIAFLVDAFRGQVAQYGLPHYALFVTYFPHLIAGPILHHKDMIPQFQDERARLPGLHLLTYGLMIFSIGLFKKTCMADGIQPFVALAFGSTSPSFDQAWIGALAYTFQLYFDFSGYSDMAVGLSLMFGIFLPLNFNSPYQARNIIDFWRRWHMTLSQFLRDYLYFSLGGNRRGSVLRYVNLMVTMVLGGLWHGAAWTFVVWGTLHGLYLCINHAWSRYHPPAPASLARTSGIAASTLTFLAVVVAWVVFRADSLPSAIAILSQMARPDVFIYGDRERLAMLYIVVLGLIAFLAPNTQQLTGYDHARRVVGFRNQSRPVALRLQYAAGGLLALAILGIQKHSEFIYFRF